MMKTPKSLRLHIALFGRMNVGKSSILNMIAGQQAAITSSVPGTTTDVVEKSMELLPIGPVVFLDTAGIDDASDLSEKRLRKTQRIYQRAEIAVLVTEPYLWGKYEDAVLDQADSNHLPIIIMVNKIDQFSDDEREGILEDTAEKTGKRPVILCSAMEKAHRDAYISDFKEAVISLVPEDFIQPPPLVGDLIPKDGHAVLIVPIDLQAPKGRLILPQVQAIRDLLDADGTVTVVKEDGYTRALQRFRTEPDLVVCDSQVVDLMVRETPESVPCTTFSTLYSRYKGDLEVQVEGVKVIDSLQPGDSVLIAEACSHHAADDDIGRVKIPRWIEEHLGFRPEIDVFSGRDYPDNLEEYKLIIHCGGCMLTRREMLMRIDRARRKRIPITNYGVAISYLHGRLDRILSPLRR
jgi:[FeFe] hydrogenase H-cluster maturation GTPase HydF